MADEFRHKDVVDGRITETEYEAVAQHILNNAVDGDFIYWDTAAGCFKRVAHTANLDAHTRNYWEVLAVGEYYIYLPISNSGIAVTTDLLRAEIFYVPRKMTFDRIAIGVQALEAAPNDGIVIGIYNSHATTLYPTTLIANSGGVVSTVTTGTKAYTIDIQLDKGIYYLAHHHESNVRKILGKTSNVEFPTPLGSYSDGDLSAYHCCGFDGGDPVYTGTLPATFAAAGARLYYPTRIALRVASLD